MDTSWISGLVGGIAAIFITAYISKKVRDSSVDGELRFGNSVIVLGWCCLGFSALAFSAFFYDNDVWKDRGEFFAVVFLVVGMGIGAIYCFGEYFKVHGNFDDEGIVFHTPWTGTKTEKWNDLASFDFNSWGNWYVLEFKSGARIRLSALLSGHGKVLDLLSQKGYLE
jgi:hypothetical protein